MLIIHLDRCSRGSHRKYSLIFLTFPRKQRLGSMAPTISKDAVHRVWREAGLKPYCLERYMASDDPGLRTKPLTLSGAIPEPSQHVAVLCVDENTAIPALDRLDPVLPLRPNAPSATYSNTTGIEAGTIHQEHNEEKIYLSETLTVSLAAKFEMIRHAHRVPFF
jgi:hypothetical protein